jgi:hypothetical protein
MVTDALQVLIEFQLIWAKGAHNIGKREYEVIKIYKNSSFNLFGFEKSKQLDWINVELFH